MRFEAQKDRARDGVSELDLEGGHGSGRPRAPGRPTQLELPGPETAVEPRSLRENPDLSGLGQPPRAYLLDDLLFE